MSKLVQLKDKDGKVYPVTKNDEIEVILDWTSLSTSGSVIYNLLKDITNYRNIHIAYSNTNSDSSGGSISQTIPVSIFKELYKNKVFNLFWDVGSNGNYIRIRLLTDTTINAWKTAQLENAYIKMYGIK